MSSANKKLLDVSDEKCPSGASTPVLSWSPLPQRKTLRFLQRETKKDSSDGSEKLYPNCDVNIWLRSCEEEIIHPLEGVVSGEIPKWLNGSLIRNGPGSLKVGEEEFIHLFDSSALLHRFGINNGKVTYQCRFLQSKVFQKNWSARRIVLTEFGTKSVNDPCHTIFQRIASIFKKETSDNAMISVYPFGDELYAFTEVPIIHKINSETLATEGRVNVSEYVSIVNHTSHPHVMNDGTVYNLGMSIYATGPHHIVVCFPKSMDPDISMFEKARIVAAVPARWSLNPSYMHSFGITENYYVIVEQPLSISITGVVSAKLTNEPIAGCLKWYHEEYTRITIISRQTGKLAKVFQAEAFFYLHVINQYEKEDHIILDICIYKDPSVLDAMYVETMKSMQKNPDYAKMFRGRPARFVLPLNPDKMTSSPKTNLVKLKNTRAKAHYLPNGDIYIQPEKLCNLGCETPRINYENYLGKPYRYFYAISSDVDADNPGTVIKVDTYTKSTKTWCEPNCYPSEPIFIPNPESKFEDDGIVVLSMIWGGEDTNHVGLLVLNAIDFTELGRAEFETRSPVPKCLHGWFLPQK
nr:carotenoid isomerooxygenase [Leptinotarsa decemlineata]